MIRRVGILATLLLFSSLAYGQNITALHGSGLPGGSLAQRVGTIYIDDSGAPDIYVCTAVSLPAGPTLPTCTWTKLGAGGGAVSSVFTRTGAVTAAANDYTLDKIGNPAAVPTFSNAANIPLTFTAPGQFNTSGSGVTSTGVQSILTGGAPSTCNLSTYFGTSYFSSALIGMACDPAGSTGVTNAYSNGVIGIYQGNNTGATGVFGWVGGVGVFGSASALSSNEHVWGFNGSVADTSGKTGNVLTGNEVDVQVANTATTGYGTLASFRGNGQPLLDTFPAYDIQAPSGSATFTSGFRCEDGAIAVNTQGCIKMGQFVAGTGATNSQAMYYYAHDASAQILDVWQLLKADLQLDQGYPIFNLATGGNATNGSEGYAIGLNPTLAVTAYQLVKVDASNPDSVLVCTTSDTYCDGIVVSPEVGGSTLCFIVSQSCPVVTGAGSKVFMTVGTGTCSIGNFVIPDTTTNGRIKCTATQPSTGYIGKALTAQAVVGSNLDVLTAFVPPTPTAIPIASVGSSGLSGTAPVTISAAGAIGCATCTTSSSALTSTALVTGGGGQASQTPSATSTLSAGGAMVLASTVTDTGEVFTGSAPSITTTGTTPYLNLNTLEKRTQNTCSFALTTSTLTLALSPVSLCTFTLPNAALTWYWTCTAGYSMPAGTTPTFEPGVNWAQSPSAAFQMAQVYSTNTGTNTSLTTSTTTNSIIINGATSGPAATVFPVYWSGKFTSSATSGTFTPTASLTGTGATGTLNGGCTIQ